MNQVNKLTAGQSLSDVVGIDDDEIQSDYAPKLKIRKKIKGENIRALGSRIPVSMIEELKMLADFHESNVEDLLAGIIESVLEDSMEAVYKKAESEARKKRASRNK